MAKDDDTAALIERAKELVSKATPGPWQLFNTPVGVGASEANGFDVAHCHGLSSHRSRDEVVANAALTAAGLALYDTRTHAAIPREPSAEMVKRVMTAIAFSRNDRSNLDMARAAIAALVGTQTQGGEDA